MRIPLQKIHNNLSLGPPEWRSGLRQCIAVLEVSLQTRAVTQPSVSGRHMRRRTIGPVSSGLGEGLAGRDVLVPSRYSYSCGEPDDVSSDTLVRLASRLSE